MYLSFVVGLFLSFNLAYGQDCLISPDVSKFRTKTLKVDDVVFHLHFPESRPWFTQKVIQTLQQDIPRANTYFKSKPQSDVHIVTIGASSVNGFESNGLATVFPYNIIRLNEFPPTANNYLRGTDEWIRNLVLHEYIHILTMDMTNGWIDTLRSLFGSVVKTNGILPRWLIEGVAVWFESTIPGQGRLNQKGVKYQVYKALTDKDFCQGISCLDTPLKYPYGHAPYWIGGEFVKYLEEINPGVMQCVFKEHSYNLPFFLNSVFKKCINMDVSEAYESFKDFYVQSNKFYDSYCPANKDFCQILKNNNIDETLIDYQIGTCQKGDYALYVKRDIIGRNRLIGSHKIVQLNSQTGVQTTFLSNYNLESIKMIGDRCVIKQNLFQGCGASNIFTHLDIPSLKTNIINESTALGLEEDSDKNIVQVHYSDGKWFYYKDNKNIKTITSETRPEFESEKLSILEDKKISIKSSEYTGTSYLTPEYFMFNYFNFANLSAINLNTALVDPLRSHTVGININDYFYKNTNLIAGSLFYTYRKNEWAVIAGGARSYFINSFDQELSDVEQFNFDLRHFYQKGSWSLSNSYSISSSKRDDFISNRQTTEASFRIQGSDIRSEIYRKQRSLSFSAQISATQADSTEKEEFLGGLGTFNHVFNKGAESSYGYNIRHGRYFKDDLKGGYFAAGGVDNFFGSGYPFPLYMLNFADLIGNEITTTTAYYDMNLKNHFKGFGMLPVFFQNSGLTLGAEYAKGKYFFTVDKLYTNEYLSGIYARYYIRTKLAYIWDASFSFVLSQLQHPVRQNRFLILFDAASF